MDVLFVVLFCLCALLHLIACQRGIEPLRRVTKPLLTPLLVCRYLAGATSASPLIVAALLCGMAGDMLLLSHRPALFAVGTGCFAIGHGCYMTFLLGHLAGPLPSGATWPYCVAYLVLTAFCAARFWPHLPQRAAPFCVLYMALLSGMSCCALLYALSGAAGGWLVFAGSLLFLVSDAILTHTTFCTTAGEHRFFVMLTYIAAQGLMTAGFLGGF